MVDGMMKKFGIRHIIENIALLKSPYNIGNPHGVRGAALDSRLMQLADIGLDLMLMKAGVSGIRTERDWQDYVFLVSEKKRLLEKEAERKKPAPVVAALKTRAGMGARGS